MVYSMTGFGRGKADSDEFSVTVEIKSVNHRFCDLIVRMPRQLFEVEDKIKKLVQTYIKRGRVEVFVTIAGENIAKKKLQIDRQLLNQYIEVLQEVKREHQLSGNLHLQDVLNMPDVMTTSDEEGSHGSVYELVIQAASQAVLQLVEMRSLEGRQLLEHILTQIEQIGAVRDKIALVAPQVIEQYRLRLQKRLNDLLGDTFDEQRVLTEAAIFAEKVDIDEELTRIGSHLTQFKKIVETEPAVGRKLDFLVQEINREINTIGAKANNGEIAQYVVEMKTALERIKEQVQNLE